MSQEKQFFSQSLSDLRIRKENTDRTDYAPLIEEAETLLQKCAANEIVMDLGEGAVSELYFLTAEMLFSYDMSARVGAPGKPLANKEKTWEYYNKAIRLQDKEEYSYGLWNFLSSAGHKEEGIAALESFIARTGGTAKVLSRAAEYILMYADSEDTQAIQRSLEYFYRAIEMEPERYETYWAFWTDLEEAVDVCPQLFKEAVLCLEKLIELSLPETSDKHKYLGNHYFDLARIYLKMKDEEKALETVEKGLRYAPGSLFGNELAADMYLQKGRFQEAIPHCERIIEACMSGEYSGQGGRLAKAVFDLGHCYHMTGRRELASANYLALENGRDIVPQKYEREFLFYYNHSNSLWGKLKSWLRKVLHKE